MILEFEDVGCKKCGSCNTDVQILIPDGEVRRGAEGNFSTEIACKTCGKIQRTTLHVQMR